MRHLGTQSFTNIDTTGEANIFDCNILNKINVPLHRPLTTPIFGDLFMETNTLKITNGENEVNALLDINNPDILKTILLNEIVYDEFFNYNKPLEQSNSFHNEIDLSTNITQVNINDTFDCTSNQDNTALPLLDIQFNDQLYAEETFLTLLDLSSNSIPLRTILYYDNTSYDNTSTVHMIYFDNITYNNITKKITLLLNSSYNSNLVSDMTNVEITSITINTFLFKDTENIDNYIGMPNHYHQLKDISDMTSNTNVENGYIKFTNNDIKFDMPWNLQVDKFKIKDSYFTKDQSDNIIKKNIFDIKMTRTAFEDDLVYTDTTVQLGQDFVIEYTFNELLINTTELIELSTNDDQEINRTKQFTLSDTTEHVNSYLVEYLKFDFNRLIDPTSLGVNDVMDVYYQQVTKSSINDPSLQIYSITDNTITTINCYYDIQITQPNINTIPFTIIQRVNLYKDDYGNIQISVPQIYKDIIGEKHFAIKNDSNLYITFDNTSFPIDLQIYSLDLITNTQELLDTFNLSDEHKRKTLTRGRIKVVPSTLLNKYTFKIFNRTQ